MENQVRSSPDMPYKRSRLQSLEPNPFEYSRSPSMSPSPFQPQRKFSRYSSPHKVSTALPSPDTTPQPPSRFSISPRESLPTPPEDFPSTFKSSAHGFYVNWNRERSTSVSSLSSYRSRSVSLSLEQIPRSETRYRATPESIRSTPPMQERLPSIEQAIEETFTRESSIMDESTRKQHGLGLAETWRPVQRTTWLEENEDGSFSSNLWRYKWEHPDELKQMVEERERPVARPLLRRNAGPISRSRHFVQARGGDAPFASTRSRGHHGVELPAPVLSISSNHRPVSAPKTVRKRRRADENNEANPKKKRQVNSDKDKGPIYESWKQIAHWWSLVPPLDDAVMRNANQEQLRNAYMQRENQERPVIPANDPNRHLLSDLEIDFCENIRWDSNKFLIAKLRLFYGRYVQHRDNPTKEFNKTRAQGTAQADVNVLSRFWVLYKLGLGMLEDKLTKDAVGKWDEALAKENLTEMVEKLSNPETASAELAHLRIAYRGGSVTSKDSSRSSSTASPEASATSNTSNTTGTDSRSPTLPVTSPAVSKD